MGGGEAANNSATGLAQIEVTNGINTPGSGEHTDETNFNIDEEYHSFVPTLKIIQKDFIPLKKKNSE